MGEVASSLEVGEVEEEEAERSNLKTASQVVKLN